MLGERKIRHNKAIRDQVIADLKAHFDQEGQPNIAAFFSGRGEPVTASDEGDFLEVPAIAVYLDKGDLKNHGQISLDEWRALLNVEIMGLCSNNLDDELDEIGEQVLEVMHTNYTANDLISLCNRKSFEYYREDGEPWGSLLLTFEIDMEID